MHGETVKYTARYYFATANTV